jgi:hypothetical protein
MLENEERRRVEKEQQRRERHGDASPGYDDLGHPREDKGMPHGQYVPGPFGMRRRGGGGEPTPVGNDLRGRHVKLLHSGLATSEELMGGSSLAGEQSFFNGKG